MGKGRGQRGDGAAHLGSALRGPLAVPVRDRAARTVSLVADLVRQLATPGAVRLAGTPVAVDLLRQAAAAADRPYAEFDLDVRQPEGLDRLVRALGRPDAVIVLRGAWPTVPTRFLSALQAAPDHRTTVVFLAPAFAERCRVTVAVTAPTDDEALAQFLAAKLHQRGVTPVGDTLVESLRLFHRIEDAHAAGRAARPPDLGALVGYAYWAHRVGPEQARAAFGRLIDPASLDA